MSLGNVSLFRASWSVNVLVFGGQQLDLLGLGGVLLVDLLEQFFKILSDSSTGSGTVFTGLSGKGFLGTGWWGSLRFMCSPTVLRCINFTSFQNH